MTEPEQHRTQEVRLVSPEANNFPAFIIGNAVACADLALPELQRVAPEAYIALESIVDDLADITDPKDAMKAKLRIINAFRSVIAEHCTEQFVVQPETCAGQTVVICGAGPTLRETAEKWVPKGDQVWGCNSALTWLHDNGHRVTHGFTVDQTPHMLTEWQSVPDVEYLLASTVHPHLTDLLIGANRRVRYFHNYVGIKEKAVTLTDTEGKTRTMEFEDWLYVTNFAPTMRAGSGLNSVTRAIDVALYMGFQEIIILGADCCMRAKRPCPKGVPFGGPEHMQWLREDVMMHADGGNALTSGATATTMEADVDGRHWVTKPDMAVSASWLVQMKRKIEKLTGKKVRIIGDTLPKAMMNQPQSWMDKGRWPHLTDSAGKPVQFFTEEEGAEEVGISEQMDEVA